MAKQIGSGFIGTVDGLSFYHNRLHGYLVRQTGGVTSKEYHKDQRYEAARDNSKEFCVVSSTGKLIREALGEFLRPVKDGTMVNRLNKELVALKQQDRTHFRGERRPDVMMTHEEANVHFRIFQFNDGVKLYDLTENYPTKQLSTNVSIASWQATKQVVADAPNAPLYAPAHRQRAGSWQATKQVVADAPNASWQAVQLKTTAFPEGATHAGLTLVRTVIDFERGRYRTVSSRMTVISKEYAETGNLTEPPGLSATGTEIVCLQVLFFKEQNGDLVQLRGKVHSMGILSVKQITAEDFGCLIFDFGLEGRHTSHNPGQVIRKRGRRRRPHRDYKRVLRGEDRHVYVQLHPPPYAPAHRQRAGSNRNERGYFVFPTTAGKQDGEKVFV
jgi:hypothetical protein